MNHYEVLEVSSNASPEVIRAAYKSLMQRVHPDKNPGDQAIAARAAAITRAYEILSVPASRAEYDARQQAPERAPARMPARAGAGRPAVTRRGAAAGDSTRTLPRAVWWLLILVVVALASALAARTVKRSDPQAELAAIREAFASATSTEARKRELYARKADILEREAPLRLAASREKSEDLARRTFVLLEKARQVRMIHKKPGGGVVDAEFTLPEISLVVGTFDTAVMLAHMANHQEGLVQDLITRLATEDPGSFIGAGADQYLKQLVLDSVTRTLATDPRQEYPSTYFESPGRYGVTDVLLRTGLRLEHLKAVDGSAPSAPAAPERLQESRPDA